jgi:hypothetical protein
MNFDRNHQSKMQTIHLAMLCFSKYIKKYTYDVVLQPLINDLQILEANGIRILDENGQPLNLRGTVFAIVGDNLGLNGIGGYVRII